MILYDRQVQGEEIRAAGRGRNDLFLLNDKSPVQQVEGGRYGRWGCNSRGGSEGCEVFLEEMTVEIRARDREQHRSGFFYPVPPLQKMLLFHPDPTRKLKKTTSRLVPRRHQ